MRLDDPRPPHVADRAYEERDLLSVISIEAARLAALGLTSDAKLECELRLTLARNAIAALRGGAPAGEATAPT